MLRTALRPRFVLFTLLMGALIAAMIAAGFWQLRRLDERRERNAAIEARAAAAPEPVASWLTPSSGPDEVDAAEWRTLAATGRYDDTATAIIRNRSFDGAPGYHVVTPLRLADGSGVLVNRGFIGVVSQAGEEPVAPPAPEGEVTVVGRVRPSQTRGIEAGRIDADLLQKGLGYPLVPAYLELVATDPEPTGEQPVVLASPELGDGPHLSYALQWFTFSAMAVGGWFLALRASHRKLTRPTPAPADRPAPGETAPVAAPPGTSGP